MRIKQSTTKVRTAEAKAGPARPQSRMTRFLLGESGKPVDVEVEILKYTQETIVQHNLSTVGDFDKLDFFIPLFLFAIIFAIQFTSAYILALFGPMGQLFFLALTIGLQLILLHFLVSRVRARLNGPTVTGMISPPGRPSYGWSLGIYLLTLPVMVGAAWLNRTVYETVFPPQQTFSLTMSLGSATGALAAIGIFTILVWALQAMIVVLLAPITEEIWFRGTGLAGFRASGSLPRAVFWTSLIFGLVHGPTRILDAGLAGFMFAFIRLRTGSLYCSIAIHMLHNLLVTVIAIASSLI